MMHRNPTDPPPGPPSARPPSRSPAKRAAPRARRGPVTPVGRTVTGMAGIMAVVMVAMGAARAAATTMPR